MTGQDPAAPKPYRTVERTAETEYVISRSRFIGRCFPVTEESEALAILEQIRKQHWDATHNCFAYRLRSGAARYSDDGEPQGTAGLPMMEVLKKRDLYDVLVISTRYFGGILLGAGGLVRMYSRAAKEAVEQAHVVVKEKCTVWEVVCSYSDHPRLLAELSKFGATAEKTDFAEAVTVRFTVRAALENDLLLRVREMSGGSIVPRKIGETFRAIG